MLRQSLRLHRAEDFQRLREVGVSYSHRLLVLSIAPNDLPHNRYGFIVSKQVGTAVIRNLIRRRLREAVRALHPQLASGYDVVLIARRPLAAQPFAVALRTVDELFRRAELFLRDTP